MNTHSHSFPLTRVLAVVFASCALLIVPAAAQADPTDPANLSITSTAPSGLKYGDKIAYTVAYDTDSPTTPAPVIDSGSTAVCKATGLVISITGAGTCKFTLVQPADDTYLEGVSAPQSFSIGKAALSVTASSSSNFFGGVVPAIVPFYSGFVNGDTSSKVTKLVCFTSAINVSNPGVYPTTCAAGTASNYTISYKDGTYTIAKAPLVLVPSATVHVGKLPKKYALEGFGWQGWDDEASNDLHGKPSCKVPSKAKRKPGIYKISCTIGKLKSLNYAPTFATGILTVKK